MDAYVRACKDGEALTRRWRLMVLGPSGDGKTSLINRLLGKGFTEEHVVTNALETDCKVKITHCNSEWKEYEADHLELIDTTVNQGIGHLIKDKKVSDQSDDLQKTNNSDDGDQSGWICRGCCGWVCRWCALGAPLWCYRSEDIRHELDTETKTEMVYDMMDQDEQQEAKIRLETISEIANHEEINTQAQNQMHKCNESLETDKKETNLQLQNQEPPHIESSELLKFILAIWDLGGQVIYYILHHIFLRWNCVYILVVNLSRPLHSKVPTHELPPHARQKSMEYYQSIEFWLNMVFSHMVKMKDTEELPSVVLVGTHKDTLHEDPAIQTRMANEYFSKLQSLFLNKAHFKQVHSTFLAVDSKNGDPENYAKLRTLIFDLVEKRCNQKSTRPIRWLRLEKKLHELKNDESLPDLDRNLVSFQRVRNFAKKFHIQSDEDLKLFLEFHHLTADITYCSREGLNDFVVLHPQWLIDVLKALITLDQFYPESQKCVQDIKQLQNEGILKTNSSLLNMVWSRFLKGDSPRAAKSYLLNMMSEFDLAVKYTDETYIIPCLLPVKLGKELSIFQGLIKHVPALYFMFHSSLDSFADVKIGGISYDNFLPHGLFQKLIAKCSKLGWAWTKERYQDSVSFTTDDVLISLHIRSTWIVLNVFALSNGVSVNYQNIQSDISGSITDLLNQYHPNMWFERGVNPCTRSRNECVLSIGSTSLDKDKPALHGVSCSDHMYSLTTPDFRVWFCSSPCRDLTYKDLKRVGNELADEWVQLNVAVELDVDENQIKSINSASPGMKMASFKILTFWYDQQVNKVEAFVMLCDALTKSGQSALIEKTLFAS